jgi:putative endonuclease
MANIFTTYILKSDLLNKTYVGHTDNLNRRLSEHNQGKSTFTKRYKPWVIIHKENFNNLEESIKREKYFKSAAGRRWIKKYLFN